MAIHPSIKSGESKSRQKNVSLLMLRLTLIFLISNICSFPIFGTERYDVINFSPQQYKSHPRNFSIAQDRRGFMYVGNAYGVLEYDGNDWRKINLPNGQSGYSLASDVQGNIFVGSFNELGVLYIDSSGQTSYRSFATLLPASAKNIGYIGKVICYRNAVYFFGIHQIAVYQNEKFTIIPGSKEENAFIYATLCGNEILVHENGSGLFFLKENQLVKIPGGEKLASTEIVSINETPEGYLIFTFDKVFRFNKGELSSHVFMFPGNEKLKIGKTILFQDQSILISTIDKGIFHVNSQGEVLRYWNNSRGLTCNNINDIFMDREGGVWMATEVGVSRVQLNTAYRSIGIDNGVHGMGYASVYFNQHLYLATSQGVFYAPCKENNFESLSMSMFRKAEGINGQVWGLSISNGVLVCTHAENIYEIKDGKTFPIRNYVMGSWKFQALKKYPGYALNGTYEGFELFEWKNNHWVFKKKLAGLNEPCRVFEEDEQGVIWMCHGNKGLYKVVLNEKGDSILSAVNLSEQLHYPATYFFDAEYIEGKLVFATPDGLFCYDALKNKFFKAEALENIFGKNVYINKIVPLKNGDVTLFTGDDAWLFRKNSSGGFIKEDMYELSGDLVGSFEFVTALNESYLIFGCQQGFKLFNKKFKKESIDRPVLFIRSVISGDTILLNGASPEQSYQWSYDFNSLRIRFSTPQFNHKNTLRYRYALLRKGEDSPLWSEWSTLHQIELVELWEGDYELKVEYKDLYGAAGKQGIFTFTILPPWYRSTIAYIIYAILFCILLYFIVARVRHNFHVQRIRLQEENEKELKLMEAEKIKAERDLTEARNKILENEVFMKNSELASLATSLAQKNEFLSTLKEKITDKSDASKNDFKNLVGIIDQAMDFDESWLSFQAHFDATHQQFLRRFREKYSGLSPSWLLLCAYIRMNKSNKEIASLFNITVAAVEKRKYRLKEKLELNQDDKLSDFILNF